MADGAVLKKTVAVDSAAVFEENRMECGEARLLKMMQRRC